jgi:hypothetical protein
MLAKVSGFLLTFVFLHKILRVFYSSAVRYECLNLEQVCGIFLIPSAFSFIPSPCFSLIYVSGLCSLRSDFYFFCHMLMSYRSVALISVVAVLG